MGKTINDIKHDYWDNQYTAQAIPFDENRILSENYIFDEDLSVRENRRMVQEHNATLEDRRRKFYADQSVLNQRLRKDLIAAIMDEYGLSNMQAKVVLNRVDKSYDIGDDEWFDMIEEEADYAYDILHA